MNVAEVRNKIDELNQYLNNSEYGSKEFKKIADKLDGILFKNMSIHDAAIITNALNAEGRVVDADVQARLVVAAEKGESLSAAVDLPIEVDTAIAIQRARHKKQLSQTELGKEVGMTQSQIAKLENLQTSMTVGVLDKIAKALDISITLGRKPA